MVSLKWLQYTSADNASLTATLCLYLSVIFHMSAGISARSIVLLMSTLSSCVYACSKPPSLTGFKRSLWRSRTGIILNYLAMILSFLPISGFHTFIVSFAIGDSTTSDGPISISEELLESQKFFCYILFLIDHLTIGLHPIFPWAGYSVRSFVTRSRSRYRVEWHVSCLNITMRLFLLDTSAESPFGATDIATDLMKLILSSFGWPQISGCQNQVERLLLLPVVEKCYLLLFCWNDTDCFCIFGHVGVFKYSFQHQGCFGIVAIARHAIHGFADFPPLRELWCFVALSFLSSFCFWKCIAIDLDICCFLLAFSLVLWIKSRSDSVDSRQAKSQHT